MRARDEEGPVLDREIEEILVDCYDEYEQAMAWLVAFQDGVKTPFSAALLGTPVEVVGFDSGPREVPVCVIRAKGKERNIWIGDLDEESLPEDYLHVLRLYDRWGGAE